MLPVTNCGSPPLHLALWVDSRRGLALLGRRRRPVSIGATAGWRACLRDGYAVGGHRSFYGVGRRERPRGNAGSRARAALFDLAGAVWRLGLRGLVRARALGPRPPEFAPRTPARATDLPGRVRLCRTG